MAALDLRVKSLFLAASEMEDAAERAAYLERECAGDTALRDRIEALIRASGDGPDAATVDYITGTPAASPSGVSPAREFKSKFTAGTVISKRYTLDEKIGEGGMGEVWVARQTSPVKRKVAVKLIRAGMDSLAVVKRFEQERQALALMDHPNIARVLDAGLTDAGQPFFVMELVNGLPLNKYCDAAKLTPRQRLELFMPICQAVQHAHQKGIVHRDLKPANILVTMIDGKPVPKVIDFGVAKATSGKLTEETMTTSFGAVIGTLEYMSPEQAGFSGEDVDTRADIYSLGVILYELLTGLKPIDAARLRKAALAEMIRIVQVDEPSKPSTRLSTDESLPSMAALRQMEPKKLMALLRGELDWIVMKCLEKQRDRRYDTANALVRDIQRYLADEVVEARPPSAGYRLQKFIRRNKGQVIAASLVLFVLVGGVIGTSIGLVRAGIAGAREKTQREKAEGLATVNAKLATDEGNARERAEYQLGINNFLLASAAFGDNDVKLAAQRLDMVPAAQRGWDWRYLKQQTSGGLFTMATVGPVTSVAFSRDGNRIATVGGNQQQPSEAKVWDARTGKLLFELKGLPVVDGDNLPYQSILFSPDDTRIITGSAHGGMKLWDARNGALLQDLGGAEDYIYCVAFSPDGSRIVVTDSNALHVRDAATGKSLLDPAGLARMYGAAFSPDGTRIVACNESRTAVVDARTGTVLMELKGRDHGGQCAAYSPDGARIIIGDDSGVATVMDAHTATTLFKVKESMGADRVFTVPPDGIMAVSFSPDGTRILTGGGIYGSQGHATVWDAKTGLELLDLRGHTDIVMAAAFSPDGTKIVTGSADATVKVWDAQTATARLDLAHQKYGVNCVAFSPDGTQIVTGASDGLSDAEARFLVRRLPGVPKGARSSNSVATLWDARTGTVQRALTGPPGRVNCVAFSPDGTRIVVAGTDIDQQSTNRGHATLWDARLGKALFEFKGLTQGVNSVAFSRDGTRIVTGGSRGDKGGPNEVKVWDAQTGALVVDMSAVRTEGVGLSMNGTGIHVAFSPDGARIVLGGAIQPDCEESEIKVMDAKTGKTVFKIKGHEGSVLGVAYTNDGTQIISTGADNLAKIWDAATGAFQMDLKGHMGPVNCAAFSRDGSRIVTGSADRSVRVWDARTGTSLVELKGHLGGINGVSFSPDDMRIVSGGGGGLIPGEVIVWEAPMRRDELKPEDQDEMAYRMQLTRPNILRYREDYLAARAATDDFAAAFYLKLVPEADRKALLAQANANTVVAMTRLADDRFYTDPEAALTLRLEILRIQKANLAPNDPGVLDATLKLGAIYSKLQQFDKAIPLLEEVYNAARTDPGLGDPSALYVVLQMGGAYRGAGRLPDAIRVFEEGSAANAAVRESLVELYSETGQYAKTIALLLKQLPEARKSNPDESATVTDMLFHLGAAYVAQKQWTEAELYLREFMTIREKTGRDDWIAFDVQSMLGASLLGQKKYSDAEPLLVAGYEGLKQREKTIPPQGAICLVESLDHLIALYSATNKPDEASKWQAERAKLADPASQPAEKK